MTADRRARLLLWLALLVYTATALHGITLPWASDPLRGLATSTFAAEWVRFHVDYGLGVTHGIPVAYLADGAERTVWFNWHHPPLYPLWLAAFAAVFGNEPWVLRVAHLLLVLPGLWALQRLVARFATPWLGSLAALLCATSPYVAYLGMMVQQDGAVLGIGLVTCWLFQRHLDAPERHRRWLPMAAFAALCLLDIPGYWFGVSCLGQVLLCRRDRHGLVALAAMFAAAVAAFVLTALHYGTVTGGPLGWLRGMVSIGHDEAAAVQKADVAGELATIAGTVLLQFGALALVALAALGAVLLPWGRRPVGALPWLGLLLAAPGLVNCLCFPSHALYHPHWPMAAFGGLAVLAAGLLPLARALQQRGGLGAVGGHLLLAALLLVPVASVVQTVRLVGHGGGATDAALASIAAASRAAADCEIQLTSAPTGGRVRLGASSIVGDVRSIEQLDFLLQVGRANRVPGQVAFLLTPDCFGTPLATRLQQLAAPQQVGNVQVFRFAAGGPPK